MAGAIFCQARGQHAMFDDALAEKSFWGIQLAFLKEVAQKNSVVELAWKQRVGQFVNQPASQSVVSFQPLVSLSLDHFAINEAQQAFLSYRFLILEISATALRGTTGTLFITTTVYGPLYAFSCVDFELVR